MGGKSEYSLTENDSVERRVGLGRVAVAAFDECGGVSWLSGDQPGGRSRVPCGRARAGRCAA